MKVGTGASRIVCTYHDENSNDGDRRRHFEDSHNKQVEPNSLQDSSECIGCEPTWTLRNFREGTEVWNDGHLGLGKRSKQQDDINVLLRELPQSDVSAVPEFGALGKVA